MFGAGPPGAVQGAFGGNNADWHNVKQQNLHVNYHAPVLNHSQDTNLLHSPHALQQDGGALLGKLQALQAQAEAKMSQNRSLNVASDLAQLQEMPPPELTPLQKLQLEQQKAQQLQELEELRRRQ